MEKLKAFCDTHNAGYGATINHNKELRHKSMEKGPVDINYNKDNPFLKAAGSDSAVSNDIWKHLKPVLNKTNIGMRSFLKNVLGVEQFHNMISEQFDNLDEFTELFKESMKNKKQSRDRVCDHGQSDIEEETDSICNREDDFDLHEALRNRMIRKVLHIVERNKEKCEEEEGSLELVQPLLDEFSELNTEEKRVNAFTYFTRVVGTNMKSEL
jgi:hypothetical protein